MGPMICHRLNIISLASSGPIKFPTRDRISQINNDYLIYSYDMENILMDIFVTKLKENYICDIFIK